MAESIGSVVSPASMKWHVALAVGLPVVVGVGYWYVIRKSKSSKSLPDGATKTRESSLDSETSGKVTYKQAPHDEALLLKEKGNKWFKVGKYHEAIACYDQAIDVCPATESMSLATFYQNKAAAYEQLQNYEEVKRACDKALDLNPKYSKALSRRAKAHENLKELALAFEDLTAVCILENFESQSTLLAADALLNELVRHNAKEALANRAPRLPSNYFITTYFSTFINDPVHPFLAKKDGDFSKGFLKAIDCIRKKEYESVIPACTEEINMREEESQYKNEALVLRGTFHQLSENYESAMADFNIVIDNEKIDRKLRVNALIKRACINIQLNDSIKYIEDFQKAIEIDEKNPDIYHHRGQINLMTDKLEEAAGDFKKAAELNPDGSIAVVQKCYTDYRCAALLNDEDKVQSTLKRFEELMQQYPNCSECYSLYAQVLCSREEYEKSDQLYKKALQLDPQNATLLVFRAIVKLKWSADIEGAIKLLKEALLLDDRCAFGYETLGTLEVQRGNLKKGIELFDKAINVSRSEGEISHFFSLKNAAEAQKKVFEKLSIDIPVSMMVP